MLGIKEAVGQSSSHCKAAPQTWWLLLGLPWCQCWGQWKVCDANQHVTLVSVTHFDTWHMTWHWSLAGNVWPLYQHRCVTLNQHNTLVNITHFDIWCHLAWHRCLTLSHQADMITQFTLYVLHKPSLMYLCRLFKALNMSYLLCPVTWNKVNCFQRFVMSCIVSPRNDHHTVTATVLGEECMISFTEINATL